MRTLVLPEKTVSLKREEFATRLYQGKPEHETSQSRVNTNLMIDYRMERRAHRLGRLEPISCRGEITTTSAFAFPCWRVQRFFDFQEDPEQTLIRTGEPYRVQPIRTDALPLDRLNARCAQADAEVPARCIEPINFWRQ